MFDVRGILEHIVLRLRSQGTKRGTLRFAPDYMRLMETSELVRCSEVLKTFAHGATSGSI